MTAGMTADKMPAADRRRHDLSTHRVAVHAAAPCPVGVKRAMIDWWGPILHEYYAATEAIGVTVIDSPTWLEKPGSVGTSLHGVLHICDDSGEELVIPGIQAIGNSAPDLPPKRQPLQKLSLDETNSSSWHGGQWIHGIAPPSWTVEWLGRLWSHGKFIKRHQEPIRGRH